ncbi:MAG: hypothetical protein HQL69_10325 [Magnetococcales bacterium]|nr:hypothetical protein [Magnetococcales bacterium]
MKSEQQFNVFTRTEANQLSQKDYSASYWIFIIQNMNYPEITYDVDADIIFCPGFIPFRELAVEIINDLDSRMDDIKDCQVCTMYFDVNKEDGIFGEPEKLNRFICSTCAQKISAKEFYESYMAI